MPELNSRSLGVCYYPEHWPEERWATDAGLMREAGLTFARIGEFAWSRLEPEPGRLEFGWLERAIETLHEAGLSVVLGTPTAAPPKWLVDSMPDMLAVDAGGRPRNFGSRRHYCFSHRGYRGECGRIVTALARRFGEHPAIVAWQTDNEYGCHDTARSYSGAALAGFREWLAAKYGSPRALNRAWGNVFWSMEYRGFEEVELPNLTVTEPNPAHALDFQRYCSDQVIAFNRIQTGIIRRWSPRRTILHNFMGGCLAFDHFALCEDLDAASWDSYPIGFLDRDLSDSDRRRRYMRAGDPDFQAFHHDLYRACGNGRWWVMEQQPGPVNWAPNNPSPATGAIRLWTHEAFSAGAEAVSYFRWRQAPFGQEQMHEALLLPDGTPNEAWRVAKGIRDEIGDSAPDTAPAPVAIMFDYESAWAWSIQPQGESFSYLDLVLTFYRALRRLGVAIDMVPARPDAAAGYRLVIIPGMFSISNDLAQAVGQNGRPVLVGPRSGSKTPDFQIPATLPPGEGLQSRIDIRIRRVESFAPPETIPINHRDSDLAFERWREFVVAGNGGVAVIDKTADGEIALCRNSGGSVHYMAGWPNEAYAAHVVANLCAQAGVETMRLPRDIRIRQNGSLRHVFNHGPETVDVSNMVGSGRVLLGSKRLEPCGVLIVRG